MNAAGQVVVITGASRGLGRILALRLAAQGADLILAARSGDQLDAVAREARDMAGRQPLTVAGDVARQEDVERLARVAEDRFGRVDVLVNNAGIGDYRPLHDMEPEAMRRQFEVNLFGPWLCIKALLPLLEKSKAGYVLSVGSVFGRVALAETSVYAASKAALARFSQGLGRELRERGIRVGLFEPGGMATSFQEGREQRAVRAPKFMILAPERAARAMAAMIRSRARRRTMPWWLPGLLRIKAAMS